MTDEASEANARGEHRLTLGRTTYVLRPAYEAIETAEEKTGLSLIQLMQRANVCGLNLKQVGIVATELIRAGATDPLTRDVNAERIGQLCYERGQHKVQPRLALVLADAAAGGRTASGEAKAVVNGSTTAD